MKTLLIVLAIVTLPIGLRGDDSSASRKTELEAVLRELNQKPEPESKDSWHRRPGWIKPELHKALEAFIAKHPQTEEAVTAKLWLTVARTESDQSNSGEVLKQRMKVHSETFRAIAEKAPLAWQQKVARLARAGVLLQAQSWDEYYVLTQGVLSDISSYTSESNAEYLRFLEAGETKPEELEPILRESLIVAACYQGKLDEALKCAEELQVKFSEWSKRNRIQGVINQLKSGHSPYRPR